MNDLTIQPVSQPLASYTITLKSSNASYLAYFSFTLHFCSLRLYDYFSTPKKFSSVFLFDPNGKVFEITKSTSGVLDFYLYNIWTTQTTDPTLRTVCFWTPTYSIIEKNPGELPLYSAISSI
jgi:hypothetical protein